jgi:hypothetical protein
MDETLRRKINLLVHLAHADNHFDIKEKAFIYNVCLRHGVELDMIGDMIEKPDPVLQLNDLPEMVRLDYLADSLLIILVDGKLLPREIRFFYQIGEQLNFQKMLLDALVSEVSKEPTVTYEILRSRIEQYSKNPSAIQR